MYKDVGRGKGNKSALKRFRYRPFHTHLFADIFYRSLFWGHGIFLFHCLQTKGLNTHWLGCCVKYQFNKGLFGRFSVTTKPRIVYNIYSWRKTNLQRPVNNWSFKNTEKTTSVADPDLQIKGGLGPQSGLKIRGRPPWIRHWALFRVLLLSFKSLSRDYPQTPP